MSQQKTKFITNNAVTNAKAAQMPANSIKGNNTGSTANGNDLTVSQVNTLLGTVLANGSVPFTADQSLGSHKLTNVTDPVGAQDAATKNYVDVALAALNPADAAYAATTTNLVGTYNNGVAGIGATFTITATGAFTLDDTTPPSGSRILIKDQTSGFQNGIYNLTVTGSLGVSPVLTRALDYDTPSDINTAGLIPIINGTVNALSSWQQTATITTIGTDALVFTEYTANPSLYVLKANNLSDVASKSTSFNNLSPMTTLGDLTYEDATPTAVRLAGNTTSTKKFLTQTGTGSVSAAPGWNTIVAADVPTLNQNTTGTASNVTGTVAIANGGTGQTAKAAAFDALQPMTTGGDVIYGGASGTGTRLANGSSGQVLTSNGGTAAPSWTTVVTSSSTIATKTANYTLLSGDGTTLVDASGGGFTITLASASSVSGQIFTVKRTDSTVANQVTISGTIDGASDWKLYTINESIRFQSDGTNYYMLQHDTATPWSSTAATTITATTTNPTKGNSPTTDTIRWRRVGTNAEIMMSFANSTATGSATGSGDYLFALPTSLTADTTNIALYTTVLANAVAQPTNILQGAISASLATPNLNTGFASLFDSTHFRLIMGAGANNGAVSSTIYALSNASVKYNASFTVPISGWKA